MILILDTSVLIDIDNHQPKIAEKIATLRSQYPSLPIKISFMTYFEFYHGLRKKAPSALPRSLAFIELFKTLITTKETARLLSQLKHRHPTATLTDLFIAAQTLEHEGILITTDKDFQLIKEINTYFL